MLLAFFISKIKIKKIYKIKLISFTFVKRFGDEIPLINMFNESNNSEEEVVEFFELFDIFKSQLESFLFEEKFQKELK